MAHRASGPCLYYRLPDMGRKALRMGETAAASDPMLLLEKSRQPLASVIQGLVIHTDELVMRTAAQ
jgi:hypothetical protein